MLRLINCITISALLLPAVARAQQATTTVASANINQTYLDFQVDKVVQVKDRVVPAYPAHLRNARVGGEVLAQFVVDERGHAMMNTFKAVKSTNVAFTESVKQAVADMTFEPAQVGGQRVKQLVQLPFKFAQR
jgi:periplasmic protein TonB